MTAQELGTILDLHHPDDHVQVRVDGLYHEIEGHSTYGYRRNGQAQEVLTLEIDFYGNKSSTK